MFQSFTCRKIRIQMCAKFSTLCHPDDLLASSLQLPTPCWTSGHVCALKPQPTCLADAYRQLDRRIGRFFLWKWHHLTKFTNEVKIFVRLVRYTWYVNVFYQWFVKTCVQT